MEQSDQVLLEVEEQQGDDLLTSASRIIGGTLPNPERKISRRQYDKQRKQAKEGDFQTTVIMLITLAIAAVNMPEDVKPNDEEIGAFSVPATRLLLRHFPIMNKLSADMVDAVGMIGALSGYYVRTRSAWASRQIKEQSTEPIRTIPAMERLNTPITPDDGFHFPNVETETDAAE